MANILSPEKQAAVVSALAEGSSIRSIERMTGIHRDTIMRLGVRVGKGCAAVMDSTMRGLDCRVLQLDEIWGFVGMKQKHAGPLRAFHGPAVRPGGPQWVAVLGEPPIDTPLAAVRAWLVSQARAGKL